MTVLHMFPQIRVTSGDTATIVTIFVKVGDRMVEVTGEAKRTPGDKNRPEVGVKLATGRALERLGRKLQREANGLVRHADQIREAKTQALLEVKQLRATVSAAEKTAKKTDDKTISEQRRAAALKAAATRRRRAIAKKAATTGKTRQKQST